MQKLSSRMAPDDAVRQTVRLRLIMSAGVMAVGSGGGTITGGGLAGFAAADIA